MNGGRRMGNQYEISLEAKELYLIIAGLLLLLVLFFFVGMIVGKKHGIDQAQVQVAAGKVPAPEEKAEGEDLTSALDFPAEAGPGVQAPPEAGEEKIEEAEEANPEAEGEEEKVEYTYYDSLVQGKGVGIKSPPDKGDAGEESAEETVPGKGEAPLPDSGEAAEDATPAETMAREGKLTIQIASFLEREQALNLVRWLRERNYPAFMVTADIPGRGTWHRVRVGRFASKADAIQYQKKLEGKIHLRGFIAEYE